MTDAALDTVARNVRAARAAAGLSLDALAARAEVSKGALVALEGARGNPNLTAVVGLAAGDVAPLWTGPSGGTARLLVTTPRPAPVEVWRWRLHPGERHESAPHPAGVTETLTVVRGQLRLVVGDTARPLHAGETTVFAADVPHAYE